MNTDGRQPLEKLIDSFGEKEYKALYAAKDDPGCLKHHRSDPLSDLIFVEVSSLAYAEVVREMSGHDFRTRQSLRG